jgi:hypothetical protein
MTFPSTSATIARTDAANTFTGVQTFSTAIEVGSGGIGVGTLASNGVLYGNGTGAVQALAVNAGATQCLTQASSGAPAWGSCGGGGASLSGLTVATGTNTIDNTLHAQQWDWSTLTTETALKLTANGITTGTSLGISTTSTALTSAKLLSISATGDPAASWTGALGSIEYTTSTDADINGDALRVGITGAGAGQGTALNITTAQTGTNALSLRVNDDGTYTDSTPFAIDKAGNTSIGSTTFTSLFNVGSSAQFQVNSSGAIVTATGLTSSGTIQFSSLTANGALYTSGGNGTLTTTAPTSGAIGYWTRTGSVLSQTTANDTLSVTGNAGDIITVASSATGASNKALNISQTGATTGTDYAGYFSNTGAATTNVGLYATATGATNNYAAIFEAGKVGIGTTAPTYNLDVTGTGHFSNYLIADNLNIRSGTTNLANGNDVINVNKQLSSNVTGAWTTGTAGGTARSGHYSVLYNGKVYSWAGRNASLTFIDTVDIYDIANDSWSTGTAGGTKRSLFRSVLYNGKISTQLIYMTLLTIVGPPVLQEEQHEATTLQSSTTARYIHGVDIMPAI